MTGKADKGEAPEACAAREALEETGLQGKLHALDRTHRYQGKNKSFVEHAFWLRVAAGAEPVLSDEHVGFRWAAASAAQSATDWPFHRETLDAVLAAWT